MTSKKQNGKGSRMDGTWPLQILAIFGSALSMVAIGILLAHFNNQPIFDWNGVTLNAIIAVFSAILKALLAYTLSECLGQAKWIWFSSQQRTLSDIDLIDSVSRGPLGSFKILTQPAARSFISMGAIIVILSVAIDPFIQLTVGQKTGVKFENNSNVQIAYAKRYSKELFEIGDSDDGAEAPMADLGMQSAVLEGLSQPSSWISQQTQRSCLSGNCTWDTFTSLAICSGCNDLTNRIEKIEGIDTSSGRPSSLNYYRLPNNLSGGGFTTPMTAYGTCNSNNTVSFTSFGTLVWSMTMMNFTMKEERTSSGNYSAIECGLWYCVNSYKSAVKNGNLTEIIQPAPSKGEIGSWRPFRKTKHDIGMFGLSPKTINSFPGETYNGSEPAFLVRRTDLQLGEGFNLSQGAIYSIGNLLHDTFTIISTPTAQKTFLNAYASRSDRSSGGPNYYPPAMQSLYNSQDLEATFASLANSMTNNIRQNSDNHTVITGKEGKYVVLIRVRGWFLTLPVILIFGGAVFLVVVLHYTHMSGMEFWGTNTLPIVALGGKMGPVFDDNDMRAGTMEQEAKRQLVQFPMLQPRRDFDRVDTTSRSENHEMISPSRTSVMQNSSPDVVSIVSPSRTSLVVQSPSPDVLSILSNDA